MHQRTNDLAHGNRFLDRPWFPVDTAIPDVVSVADRRVREHPPVLSPPSSSLMELRSTAET